MKDDADLLNEIAGELLSFSSALEKAERPKLMALCERLVAVAVRLAEGKGTISVSSQNEGHKLRGLLRKSLPYVDNAGETSPERLRAHHLSVLIRHELSSG